MATDFNPGSAPSYHLPFALTLACTLQRMTPAEALKGATVIAARAVGLASRIGSLEPGKAADFAVIDAPDVNHWLYHLRPNACSAHRSSWPAQDPPGTRAFAVRNAVCPRRLPRPSPFAALYGHHPVTSSDNPHTSRRRHGTTHVCGASSRFSSSALAAAGSPGAADQRAHDERPNGARASPRRHRGAGTQIVAQAGSDGRFILNAPDGAADLMVRGIGFKRQQINVPASRRR